MFTFSTGDTLLPLVVTIISLVSSLKRSPSPHSFRPKHSSRSLGLPSRCLPAPHFLRLSRWSTGYCRLFPRSRCWGSSSSCLPPPPLPRPGSPPLPAFELPGEQPEEALLSSLGGLAAPPQTHSGGQPAAQQAPHVLCGWAVVRVSGGLREPSTAMADARPQEEPGPQAWARGVPCRRGLGTLGLRLRMAQKIDKVQGLPSASRGTGLTADR